MYVATDEIDACELIIVEKPHYFKRIEKEGLDWEASKKTIESEILHYSMLQRSFYHKIKEIQAILTRGKNGRPSSVLLENRYMDVELPELRTDLDQIVYAEKTLCKPGNSFNVGIWPKMFRVGHMCNSNCTFIHFKGALAIFAKTTITRG